MNPAEFKQSSYHTHKATHTYHINPINHPRGAAFYGRETLYIAYNVVNAGLLSAVACLTQEP